MGEQKLTPATCDANENPSISEASRISEAPSISEISSTSDLHGVSDNQSAFGATEHSTLEQFSVLDVLSGKKVLITGTTGFVGKVVLEKLLRDVSEIGQIYLLIRGNKQYPDAHSRFINQIANSSIFEQMQKDDPQRFDAFCEEKIHCITGEVTETNFGLNTSEYNRLVKQVDVVINSAASVNFREELDQALSINTLSLYNIAEFAKLAGGIPVLQVSTCYVNGFNQGALAEENVAPASGFISLNQNGYYDVEPLIEVLQRKIADIKACHLASGENRTGIGGSDAAEDNPNPDVLKKKLIDLGIAESNRYGWNDTYTFTKWLGEQLLRKALVGSPLTILRPAIVESTLASPVPGWIEGVKVADAILMAYAREKVTFFPGDPNGIIDIIPADLVANSIILGVAELVHDATRGASEQAHSRSHRVYQCCSGGVNPLSIREMIQLVQQEADDNYQQHPKLFYRQPKRPFVMVSKRVFSAMMNAMRLPLIAINKLSKRLGHDAQAKSLGHIDTAMNLATIFSFYSEPKYRFYNDKLVALSHRVREAERPLFPVDARLIDWGEYIRTIHIPGLNRYALKERTALQRKRVDKAQKSKAA
ncbi:fatty acyl-CoA reductase [Alkalimarinus coralli]|uniref:fatty acyl-CoA reductase n=1 Tax=Alkalimarinus coralli TaxID=2935863 RepID=UPI00202AD89A|nr:fatty acyl-CoA reductase [Alkalimarinus coralli]